MRSINKVAAKFFLNTLVKDLEPGGARKFDNAGSGIMAVSIDFLSRTKVEGGSVEMYAVAHRYECNGDLVPDPDVEFFVMRPDAGEATVCPTAIDQAIGYRRSVFFDKGALPTRIAPHGQADLAVFCGVWLRNIKQQQGL